jgi:enoyl-CoA hydratase/carnithine racemase
MSFIHTEQRNDACWVTIDNGPRNLLNPTAMRELVTELRRAEAGAAKAVVLTGQGEMFCGGLDVDAIKAGGDPVEFATELVALLRVVPRLGLPVLGAINGDALASGFSLALTTDMAVTVEGARLGTFEASIGIWPMIAQVPPLQRLLPRHALANVLTGVPLSAEEALAAGAVNAVVPRSDLAKQIDEWVGLTTRAGTALPSGRQAFYRFLDLSYDDALDQSLAEFAAMFRS